MALTSDSEIDTQNAPSPLLVVASMEKKAQPSTSKRGRKSFLTPRVLGALDKWRISTEAAMHLLTAVAEALGHSIDEYAINIKTLSRLRKEHAEETAKAVKENFQVCTGKCGILY